MSRMKANLRNHLSPCIELDKAVFKIHENNFIVNISNVRENWLKLKREQTIYTVANFSGSFLNLKLIQKYYNNVISTNIIIDNSYFVFILYAFKQILFEFTIGVDNMYLYL